MATEVEPVDIIRSELVLVRQTLAKRIAEAEILLRVIELEKQAELRAAIGNRRA